MIDIYAFVREHKLNARGAIVKIDQSVQSFSYFANAMGIALWFTLGEVCKLKESYKYESKL